MRSHVEAQLDLIARGSARRAHVVAHILAEFEAKFKHFASQISILTQLLEHTYGSGTRHAVEAQAPTGADELRTSNQGGVVHGDGDIGGGETCNAGSVDRVGDRGGARSAKLLCRPAGSGHFLRLLSAPSPRLHDPRTEEVWPLPLGGAFKPYHERRCPLCDFELLLYVVSSRGGAASRTYPLCPYCYSRPPLEGGHDATAAGRCSRCPHPEHHPIVDELALCACPETAGEGGKLLLDPSGGPNWRLISSRGAYTLPLPPFVHSLAVGAPCGCAGDCRRLRVEFQRDRSPLEDSATSHLQSPFPLSPHCHPYHSSSPSTLARTAR